MPELQTQPDSSPTPPHDPGATSDGADSLGKLKKMSTTAGVGTQEYVAINPLAVVACLLGVASLLALMADVLLVIPLAGVVCAAVSWRQIRNSNGTQSGAGLVVAGLALSILLGGAVLGYKGWRAYAARSDEEAVAALIRELGQDVSAGRYREGRQLFSERFRARVDERNFATNWEQLQKLLGAGNIRSMEWNGTRLEIAEDRDTGGQIAYGMAIFTVEQPVEPKPRRALQFAKTGGKWVIDDFPDVFPIEKKKPAPKGQAPGG